MSALQSKSDPGTLAASNLMNKPQSVRAFSGNPALVDRERRLAGLRGVDLTCRGPRGWGKHVSGR
jgi:hypothetical protein